ncbi:MAG: hypothetical protein QMC81_00275 [Thermoanaerobacterales bacterium]|nr:hypothetical protein [Bacillota bacterium]MDI6905906.1 hypothetical protein [Thermoanaerobacterales bacterium]
MARKHGLTAFQIAAAYIAVTIGAGFASGQEVLQFFAFFGPDSFSAVILATVLFIFFGAVILQFGHELGARSHLEIIRHAGGPLMGAAMDVVVTFFLFGGLAAMLAGAGATVGQQFGLAPWTGSVAMLTVTLGTVLLGLTGILCSFSFLVPVLILGVVALAAVILFLYPPSPALIQLARQPWAAAVPSWPVSALTYVSYNIVIAVAVLGPLGALAERRRFLTRGAIAGGVGVGVGVLAINLVLLSLPDAAAFPIPMAYAAGVVAPFAQAAYAGVLLAAIYTTAVGDLFGFTSRFAAPGTGRFRLIAAGAGLAALGAGQLGFTVLVRFLYAGVGIAGFLLLGALVYGYFRARLPLVH